MDSHNQGACMSSLHKLKRALFVCSVASRALVPANMAEQRNLEREQHYLWKTSLCQLRPKHDSDCEYRHKCRFTHSLFELRFPDKDASHHWPTKWSDGKVDRWAGQNMSTTQMSNIRWYWDRPGVRLNWACTPACYSRATQPEWRERKVLWI